MLACRVQCFKIDGEVDSHAALLHVCMVGRPLLGERGFLPDVLKWCKTLNTVTTSLEKICPYPSMAQSKWPTSFKSPLSIYKFANINWSWRYLPQNLRLLSLFGADITQIKEKLSLVLPLFPKCLCLHHLLLCLPITSLELDLLSFGKCGPLAECFGTLSYLSHSFWEPCQASINLQIVMFHS